MGLRQSIEILNQKGTPAFYTDTFANRPTFGFKGRVFIATDTQAIYEDTGTAWTLIANVGVTTTPTLQAVCTAGNTYTGDAYFNSIRIGHGGPTSVATNTLVGQGGLNAINVSFAGQNSAFGRDALTNLQTGSENTAIGYQSGYIGTSNSGNVFVGSSAGYYTTGSYNVLIGRYADTGSASYPNLGATNNVFIGAGFIGQFLNSYTSYNVIIGHGSGDGYTGNGVNGLNTFIGSLLSVSATPTITGNIIMGNNTGKKIQNYASGNWVLGGGADNGIQQLQLSGGLYAQTLSASGVTFSANLTPTLGSTNFYYVYTGAGFNTFTFPTALSNNNMYVIKNMSANSITIACQVGQNMVEQYNTTLSATITLFSGSKVGFIADGNNKFYQIF